MSENIKNVTDGSFAEDVLNAEGPVLVDYWAEWCGPCKMIAPIIEEIAEEYGDRLTVAKMDIEMGEYLVFVDVLKRHLVDLLPTRRQHDDGALIIRRAAFLTDAKTIFAGEIHIQHDCVRFLSNHALHGRVASALDSDLETVLLQEVADHRCEFVVVFDDENAIRARVLASHGPGVQGSSSLLGRNYRPTSRRGAGLFRNVTRPLLGRVQRGLELFLIR